MKVVSLDRAIAEQNAKIDAEVVAIDGSTERFEELRQESIIASACEAIADAICEQWPTDRNERWRPILETAIRQAVEHEIAAITRQAREEA